MHVTRPFFELSLAKSEVCFFLIIFLVFPITTDFEVWLYEPGASAPSFETFIQRVVYGLLGMVPYLVYYRLIIPYIFEKRYVIFACLIVVFLVSLSIYTRYEHWLVSKLVFLPTSILVSARKWFELKPALFRFSVIFVFRELLMFTALAYFIRSSNQERQVSHLKRQQLEAELGNLKIQLQPHFFFNTLNNIYSLALQNSENTAPLVAKHADMMRYILYHSTKSVVSLRKEIDFLVNYADVEALRYPAKIDISFDAQGINDQACIEPLLLLPFVENAFKHGIREETGSGYVRIIICMVDNEFDMEISNSKILKTNASVPKGIGLENALVRLKLLYPDHRLFIEDQADKFEVRLHLTLADL